MDFFDKLVRFETALWNAIEKALLLSDLPGLATLQALRVLQRYEGAGRVHDLSRELAITIGAASKLVDRLERGGLAVRRPHPDDRRSSLVSLSPSGERARVAGEEVARRSVSHLLGESVDVEPVSSALTRLQAQLDSATVGA